MHPEGDKPTQDVLSALAKSYDLMNYDVGLLPRDESIALEGVALDTSRRTADEEPFTVITTATGDRVGFLRFPSLPDGEDIPSDRLIAKISAAVKEQQSAVRLIVALSDWGWVGEREYLAQNPDFVPDILLGSGRGSGVNGRIDADDRCTWVRPYDKGRTLSEVKIFSWPDRTSSFTWDTTDSIKTLSIGLGDQYQDNPDVGALLH